MTEPLAASQGLNVAHLFWKVGPLTDHREISQAIENVAGEPDTQIVTATILGHKADLVTMVLSQDQRQLRRLQTALAEAGLELCDSYLSMTEVSEYAAGMPEAMLNARLYPQLPPEAKPCFCFYPMSKRRVDGQNWFTLDFDDRSRLMREHGTSGRKFAGRVLQVVTGSTGLDDFEWGVTLFCQKPDDIKDVVYTMRFDEASAVYAEFGTFYVGEVGSVAEVLSAVGTADH